MKLAEMRRILEADLLCGEKLLLRDVVTVCGSDLLSDVLALTIQETLLLTGLTNVQVIRTADLSDLVGIVFVNGKRPGAELVSMAQQKGIPLFTTRLPMYEACGRLYQYGLKGCI